MLETGVYWIASNFLCLGHKASLSGLHRFILIVKAHTKLHIQFRTKTTSLLQLHFINAIYT
jgi:hypothetical protein